MKAAYSYWEKFATEPQLPPYSVGQLDKSEAVSIQGER
jgi:hypothetical protein